jgi:acyl-CoA thioesterase I
VRYSILLLLVVSAACSTAPKTEPANSRPAPESAESRTLDSRHRLVAFGDSLTAGFGAPAGASYPDFLQKLIDAKRHPWQVINAGVSGDTSTDGLARLPSVLEYKPDIVILELGANDGLRGIPVDATRANLDELIAGLERAGAKVVLAGMTLPPNYGPDYIRPFEKIFTDLAAKYKLKLVPFLLDGVGGNASLMQRDGLHPTAEGNRRVAANVMRVVEPLLSR